MLRKEIQAPMRDPVQFVKAAGMGKTTTLLPVQQPPGPRVPAGGEATGYGATFRRDLGAWVLYWMPGAVPLGVTAETREACDLILGALRTTLAKRNNRPKGRLDLANY